MGWLIDNNNSDDWLVRWLIIFINYVAIGWGYL